MSDFAAGSASGAHEGGVGVRSGGSPPPVLLGALVAAALIVVIVVALLSTGGGGGDGGAAGPSRGAGAAAAATPAVADTDTVDRVTLSVVFDGDGSGRVEIGPRNDVCRDPCAHSYATGTRVTVTAEPASGSTFDGWDESCSGSGHCTFVMDKQRALKVTFGVKPDAAPPPDASDDLPCDGSPDDDPACTDGLDSGSTPTGSSDCHDGKDNDGDGLIDSAQDPGCDADGTEAETIPPADVTPAPPPPPPPAAAVSDCADGRDNDHDGLTDTAQDPDCVKGHSESGASATRAPTTTPSVSECMDGKDNDGDGLIDRAQDPGCAADGTEY